jgi:hypothetical protein
VHHSGAGAVSRDTAIAEPEGKHGELGEGELDANEGRQGGRKESMVTPVFESPETDECRGYGIDGEEVMAPVRS